MDKKTCIGIDARMIRHSGIGTYLGNLLGEIPGAGPRAEEIRLFGESEKLRPFAKDFTVCEYDAPIYSLVEQVSLRRLSGTVGLWHSPHFNVPVRCASRLVVTVHDLIPWIFADRYFSKPKKLYFEFMMKVIRRKALRVIAVSNHTRNDLVRLFGFREERIRVIHEGVSGEFQPVRDGNRLRAAGKKYSFPEGKGFFLYLGLLKPHKNVGLLVRTVKNLRKAGKLAEKLVIVGKKDVKYPESAKNIEEICSDEDVIYIPSVEPQELAVLYSMATCFVQPSLYEGFGLPVLEAMACGTPVIVSDRASLPEIAGDAALCFEAESEESLAKALLEVSGDPRVREALVTKGFQRVRKFSWKRMAEETLEVYKEALAC